MKIADDIIASLEAEPKRWRVDYCTYRRDDGIEVWRANVPILNVQLNRPVKVSFGLIDKFRIWRAFRRWKNNIALDSLSKGIHP